MTTPSSTAFAITVAVSLVLPVFLSLSAMGQQAHRCVDDSGAIIFSDRPCETADSPSDSVDITPHQGHRTAPPRTLSAPSGPDATTHVVPISPRGQNQPRTSPQRNSTLRTHDPEVDSLLRERNRIISRMSGRHVRPSQRERLEKKLSDVTSQLEARGFNADEQHGASSQRDSRVIGSNRQRVEAWNERRQNRPNDEITTVPVFNPETGRYLLPAGPNTIDTETGDVWLRSQTGFSNPRTGDQVFDPNRSPP